MDVENRVGRINDIILITLLMLPGTAITFPFLKALYPYFAISAASAVKGTLLCFDPEISATDLAKFVFVCPGQSKVAVTPVPFSSFERDNVKELINAFEAA